MKECGAALLRLLVTGIACSAAICGLLCFLRRRVRACALTHSAVRPGGFLRSARAETPAEGRSLVAMATFIGVSIFLRNV